MEKNKWKIIDSEWLKYIAIIAMTMDHFALIFFASGSTEWTIFRAVGRITFPVMAFMLSEGFLHTHNLKKYAVRLFLFSVLGWFTLTFYEAGTFLPIQLIEGQYTEYPFSWIYIPSLNKTLCISRFSVITGLLCALLSLVVWEKTKWRLPKKILATCGLFLITLNVDWYWLCIPMVMCFYYFRDNKPMRWLAFTALELLYVFDVLASPNLFDPYLIGGFRLYRLGVILPFILSEFLYNGEKGKGGAFRKWFFYIYYPVHLIILGILQKLFAS